MATPLQSWFEDASSALAYSICGSQGAAPPFNDVANFLQEQWSRLPDYLRFPMKAATLLFDTAGIFRAGRMLHCCQPSVRARILENARNRGTGVERDLLRYYESLATLALHGRANSPGVTPHMPALPPLESAPAPEMDCDIAVIGSGPGGAITACLLAEAGKDVLLIEEGPHLRLQSCAPFSLEEMRQKYRNGGQTVALGRNKVAYVEGCCVGGGSEINSGLYHRTPAEVLQHWQKEFSVRECAATDLLPHFEAGEADLSVSHLPGGAPEASLRLDAGARTLGWKSVEVPRWFKYSDGSGTGGTRQSMTETFVPRFLRAGGRLISSTRAKALRDEHGTILVEALHRQQRRISIRAQTVFVCAGAVQTPALLRRSGFARNVGNALRLHPTIKVLARFADPVNSRDMGVPVHQVKEFAPALSFGCSISTPSYVALGLLDHPAERARVSSEWRHMANYYAMTAAEGFGTIRVVPGFRDPLVRYHLANVDRASLAIGLRRLCKLLLEAGAVDLFPAIARHPAVRTRRDVDALPESLPEGAANLMTIHLFSSCPMGENVARCATNSFGQLHDHPRIYVNDASLLCTAPAVNPQGTIMAIARRNVLNFLHQSRR